MFFTASSSAGLSELFCIYQNPFIIVAGSPDNLLFLYRVMAELCGIKRNISKFRLDRLKGKLQLFVFDTYLPSDG